MNAAQERRLIEMQINVIKGAVFDLPQERQQAILAKRDEIAALVPATDEDAVVAFSLFAAQFALDNS